jgi:hypothetical protein
LDVFFDCEQCKIDPKQMGKIFEPTFSRICHTFKDLFGPLKITEAEIVAYYGILFWDESKYIHIG